MKSVNVNQSINSMNKDIYKPSMCEQRLSQEKYDTFFFFNLLKINRLFCDSSSS